LLDFPIIDAHQHFWDLDRNYLPWLCDEPPISFRYGDYRALKRNYLPADYLADAEGFNVAATVFVETEWDRADPVGEMRWVQSLIKRSGLPTVAVCHVPLHEPRAADLLLQQTAFDFVRGVRHKPRASSTPDSIERGAFASMTDPEWRRGYDSLAHLGFSFDLQTPWWHLYEAAELNAEYAKTCMILDHTGLPADRSVKGLNGWRAAMKAFASAPNVAVKISGLGEAGLPWSLERNRAVILETIEIFGEDRCMFASNFPVDSLVGDFNTIYLGYIEATRPLGPLAQAKLFAENARRLYRITAEHTHT
jgi:predicted TIM-barrel fold metal-dependent hydrolase